MHPDRQGLDERALLERERVRQEDDLLGLGHEQVASHARGLEPADLQFLADVVLAAKARAALAARLLRPGGGLGADGDARHAVADGLDHGRELVALDNRERREGMTPVVHVNVRATHPDPLDLQQDLSGSGARRIDVAELDNARLGHNCLSHEVSFSSVVENGDWLERRPNAEHVPVPTFATATLPSGSTVTRSPSAIAL